MLDIVNQAIKEREQTNEVLPAVGAALGGAARMATGALAKGAAGAVRGAGRMAGQAAGSAIAGAGDKLAQNIKNKLDKSMSEDMGDMFICRNVIKKNAEIYNKDFVEELQYIVIHGLLHLIGYSHKKNDKLKTYEKELMKRIWNES